MNHEYDLVKDLSQSSSGAATHNQQQMQRDNLVKNLSQSPGKAGYMCPHCCQIFSTRWIMNRHMLTHTPNKVQCPVCEKYFTRKDNLNFHINKYHPEYSPNSRGDGVGAGTRSDENQEQFNNAVVFPN